MAYLNSIAWTGAEPQERGREAGQSELVACSACCELVVVVYVMSCACFAAVEKGDIY